MLRLSLVSHWSAFECISSCTSGTQYHSHSVWVPPDSYPPCGWRSILRWARRTGSGTGAEWTYRSFGRISIIIKHPLQYNECETHSKAPHPKNRRSSPTHGSIVLRKRHRSAIKTTPQAHPRPVSGSPPHIKINKARKAKAFNEDNLLPPQPLQLLGFFQLLFHQEANLRE